MLLLLWPRAYGTAGYLDSLFVVTCPHLGHSLWMGCVRTNPCFGHQRIVAMLLLLLLAKPRQWRYIRQTPRRAFRLTRGTITEGEQHSRRPQNDASNYHCQHPPALTLAQASRFLGCHALAPFLALSTRSHDTGWRGACQGPSPIQEGMSFDDFCALTSPPARGKIGAWRHGNGPGN